MNCPHCPNSFLKNSSSPAHWIGFAQIPYDCGECGKVAWIDNETVGINPLIEYKAKIPELEEDTVIYVTNKEHTRWLQPAIILKKDHIHYRLLFPDNVRLWMPEHWVKPVPAQML